MRSLGLLDFWIMTGDQSTLGRKTGCPFASLRALFDSYLCFLHVYFDLLDLVFVVEQEVSQEGVFVLLGKLPLAKLNSCRQLLDVYRQVLKRN